MSDGKNESSQALLSKIRVFCSTAKKIEFKMW